MIILTKFGFADEEGVVVKHSLPYLKHGFTVEEGATLGDLFQSVEREPALMVLIGVYSNCYDCIKELHEEAKLPPKADDDDAPLVYLKVDAHLYTTEGDFDLHIGFAGCSVTGGVVKEWGLDASPMNKIAHLPLRIDEYMSVDRDESKTLSYQMSFIDALDAIYTEISFYGPPEKRDTLFGELNETIDKIRSGELETFPYVPENEEVVNA